MTLGKIPEVIDTMGTKLVVMMEGRKPRCFKCGKKGHVRSECKSGEEKEKEENNIEEDSENETTENGKTEKESTEEENESENKEETEWEIAGSKRKLKRNVKSLAKMQTQRRHKNAKKSKTKELREKEVLYMAVRNSNSRLMSQIQIKKLKRTGCKNVKDGFEVYHVDRTSYNVLANDYQSDVGPMRWDISDHLYEGLLKTTPRAREKEKEADPPPPFSEDTGN
ncbi:XP_029647626.1protein SREK1IP1-like [Octopus vulgaris]|uniref:XP_029647626.1protein SREK1IP1-like n=1 Tax=Octopus vulgaris TaxID=6645 RepID=A0AA36F3R2_OCTVU|nr:XP_029647626.1protein SREK1IP1-like [Octopus vulgaris]